MPETVIQKFWRENHTAKRLTADGSVFTQCTYVVCADGFTMSVQASEMHYCLPRCYLAEGDYAAFEVGFPSARDELLMPYVEDLNAPTETVYGYVPIEVIDAVIEAHGGLPIAAEAPSEAA